MLDCRLETDFFTIIFRHLIDQLIVRIDTPHFKWFIFHCDRDARSAALQYPFSICKLSRLSLLRQRHERRWRARQPHHIDVVSLYLCHPLRSWQDVAHGDIPLTVRTLHRFSLGDAIIVEHDLLKHIANQSILLGWCFQHECTEQFFGRGVRRLLIGFVLQVTLQSAIQSLGHRFRPSSDRKSDYLLIMNVLLIFDTC